MQIFITRGEDSSGPFTVEEVRNCINQGTLLPNDLAYHDELEDWITLSELMHSESKHAINSQDAETGNGKEDSIARAAVTSVGVFLLLMLLLAELYWVLPKFEDIFRDMLGPEEGLPFLTKFFWDLSGTLQNNPLPFLRRYLPLSISCAGIIGFLPIFSSQRTWKIVRSMFFVIYITLLFLPIIAMFLPLYSLYNR